METIPTKDSKLSFACDHCGATLRIPIHLAGVEGPCPKCKKVITAPEAPKAQIEPLPTRRKRREPRKLAPLSRPKVPEVESEEEPPELPEDKETSTTLGETQSPSRLVSLRQPTPPVTEVEEEPEPPVLTQNEEIPNPEDVAGEEIPATGEEEKDEEVPLEAPSMRVSEESTEPTDTVSPPPWREESDLEDIEDEISDEVEEIESSETQTFDEPSIGESEVESEVETTDTEVSEEPPPLPEKPKRWARLRPANAAGLISRPPSAGASDSIFRKNNHTAEETGPPIEALGKLEKPSNQSEPEDIEEPSRPRSFFASPEKSDEDPKDEKAEKTNIDIPVVPEEKPAGRLRFQEIAPKIERRPNSIIQPTTSEPEKKNQDDENEGIVKPAPFGLKVEENEPVEDSEPPVSSDSSADNSSTPVQSPEIGTSPKNLPSQPVSPAIYFETDEIDLPSPSQEPASESGSTRPLAILEKSPQETEPLEKKSQQIQLLSEKSSEDSSEISELERPQSFFTTKAAETEDRSEKLPGASLLPSLTQVQLKQKDGAQTSIKLSAVEREAVATPPENKVEPVGKLNSISRIEQREEPVEKKSYVSDLRPSPEEIPASKETRVESVEDNDEEPLSETESFLDSRPVWLLPLVLGVCSLLIVGLIGYAMFALSGSDSNENVTPAISGTGGGPLSEGSSNSAPTTVELIEPADQPEATVETGEAVAPSSSGPTVETAEAPSDAPPEQPALGASETGTTASVIASPPTPDEDVVRLPDPFAMMSPPGPEMLDQIRARKEGSAAPADNQEPSTPETQSSSTETLPQIDSAQQPMASDNPDESGSLLLNEPTVESNASLLTSIGNLPEVPELDTSLPETPIDPLAEASERLMLSESDSILSSTVDPVTDGESFSASSASSVLDEPRNILDSFIKAQTWEERVPHIYQGETLQKEIQEYYTERPDPVFDLPDVEYSSFGIDPDTGGNYYVYDVRTRENPEFLPIVIRMSPESPGVDWSAFKEFKDRTFADFIDQNQEGPATFRLQVKRASYFGQSDGEAFDTKDDYHCFKVSPPYYGYEKYAFVKKDTPLGEEMEEICYWGMDPALLGVFTLEREAFPHGVDHLVIKEIKGIGLIPPADGDYRRN